MMEPAVEDARTPTELAEKYYWWACREATRFHRHHRRLELAELFGVAGEALCRAARNYRHDLGVPFCGYAREVLSKWFCRYAIISRRRGLTTKAGGRKGANYRTDMPAVVGMEAAIGRPCREQSRPIDPAIWERIRPLLGARDYEILLARFRDGEEYQAIAARYGVVRQRVHQITHRALEVLRQFPELADG